MSLVILLLLRFVKSFSSMVYRNALDFDIWVDKKTYLHLNHVNTIEGATEWQDAIWEELDDEDREDLDGPRYAQEVRLSEWVRKNHAPSDVVDSDPEDETEERLQ